MGIPINYKAQAQKVIDEIKRNYTSRMIFTLDDLQSYNVAKSASNFNAFASEVRKRVFEVAYKHSSDSYIVK